MVHEKCLLLQWTQRNSFRGRLDPELSRNEALRSCLSGRDLTPLVFGLLILMVGGSDDEDDSGDGVVDWNLRKCAAAGLDNISGTFGAEHVLPALLSALEVRVTHIM